MHPRETEFSICYMIHSFSRKKPVELQRRDTWRKDSRKIMVKQRKDQLHITKCTPQERQKSEKQQRHQGVLPKIMGTSPVRISRKGQMKPLPNEVCRVPAIVPGSLPKFLIGNFLCTMACTWHSSIMHKDLPNIYYHIWMAHSRAKFHLREMPGPSIVKKDSSVVQKYLPLLWRYLSFFHKFFHKELFVLKRL